MTKNLFRAFVFLDRDGTIIEEMDDIKEKIRVPLKTPGEIKIISGVSEAIKLLNQNNYCVVIITNQPHIAKGSLSVEEVEMINKALIDRLRKEGARIDAVFYCPHHPQKGHAGERPEYKIKCECRKPEIGMLKQAASHFGLKLDKNSFVIGDQTRDVNAAKNALCTSILVKTGYGGSDGAGELKPDYVCKDLLEAAKIIISKTSQTSKNNL